MARYDFCAIGQERLRAFAGSHRQLAGVRRAVLDDGKGRGARIADINNGSGLTFTVTPDRALDIVDASFRGIPLAWRSANGYCSPHAYEPEAFGWLRTWPGGLMTTCGLRNVGGPSAPKGLCAIEAPMGLHGRVSHIPADAYSVTERWVNGKLELSVSGRVEETFVFGEKIVLERKIATWMGEDRIEVRDTITNEGFSTVPLMTLYHINLGYPLLSAKAELAAADHEVIPRPTAVAGLDRWHLAQDPTPGYAEQCFLHKIPPGDDGMATIALRNPELGIEFEVAYRTEELPNLMQWKMMGQGEYVMGLEPCDNRVMGLAEETEKGELGHLAPGQSVEHLIVMSVRAL